MSLEAVGLLVSIVVIVIMIRRGYKLLWALVVGSAFISIFSLFTPKEILSLLIKTVQNPATIFLILMVTSITLLGYALNKTGNMEQLVESMCHLITDTRLLAALLPAVVSFLSIPGGAVISAPMVDKAAKDLQLSRVNLSLVNLLFRHHFIMISPLYASVIFMSSMTGESIFRFILFALPVFAVTLVVGFFYVFRQATKVPSEKPVKNLWPRIVDLLISFSPFLVIFSFYLIFNFYLPFAIFLAATYSLLLYLPKGDERKPQLQKRLHYLYQGINWPMVATTFVIMFYKTLIENADSLSIGVKYILDRGFPLILLVILLPYLLSLTIGNSVASLGIVVPLLLPVLNGGPSQMAHYGIIYISAHLGYLGSPIHLCTYLTTEYFKAPLFHVILKMNLLGIPALLTAVAQILFY